MKGFMAALAANSDKGLALVRIMMGIILVWHGYGKLTHGWAIGFFDKVGIPVAQVTGPFITLLETLGGIALILGLFTRYLGVLFTVQFLVAAYVQWFALGKGYPGAEIELLLLFCGVLFATNGSGAWSLGKKMNLGG